MEPRHAGGVIPLMLNRDLAQMRQDILHLGIAVGSLDTSEVIQPLQLIKQVIHKGDDDGDGDRVGPNNDDGDNGGVARVGEELVMIGWR